jgi:chromosome segregation ATPase
VLRESLAGLETEYEDVWNNLTSKNEECNRLQQIVAKLRAGNQLLDVSASRLQKEREATRIELEASRRGDTTLQDIIARLEADREIQASRIAGLQRQLADNNAKAKLDQEASRQMRRIKKHWARMTEIVGSIGNDKVHEKGFLRDDLIVLDD